MKRRLKLTLNIGSRDQARYGLSACRVGEIVEVEAETAEAMLAQNWAVQIAQPAPAKPEPPPPAPVSEPSEPEQPRRKTRSTRGHRART